MYTTRHALLPVLAGALLAIPSLPFADDSADPAAYAASAPDEPRVVARGLSNPSGIAVRGGELFVAVRQPGSGGALARIDLSTGRILRITAGPDSVGSFGLDRDEAAFWARESHGTLVAISRSGSGPRELASSLRAPGAASGDGLESIYFVEDRRSPARSDAYAISTLRAGQPHLLVSTGRRPTAIAASADGDVYWVSAEEGLLHHLGPDGRSEVLLRGLERPGALALDPGGRAIYFTEVPTPGVAGDAGGRNRIGSLDLRSRFVRVISHGDPSPAGLAAAEGGRVFWTSSSRGLVLQASCSDGEDEGEDEEEDGRERKFRATLSGAEETPPVVTGASGRAKLELKESKNEDDDDEEGDEDEDGPGNSTRRRHGDGGSGRDDAPLLKYAVKARNLSSGVTGAHLHLGAFGRSGPVVASLAAGPRGRDREGKLELEGKVRPSNLVGPFAGSWDGFVAALRAGDLYVNIHTSKHPDGEIRGQLYGREVPVELPPDGTITSPAGNVTINAGEAVYFAGTATDPNGDAVTVLWDFGDGGSSTSLEPGNRVYATAGTYTVTFLATDITGRSGPTPDARTIVVLPVGANQPPNGTITSPVGDVTITAGSSVSFAGSATDPEGGTVTVLWSFGDGESSTAFSPGPHVYQAAGSYTVTFTATDSAGLADPTPDTRTITVNPAGVNQPPDGTITMPSGDVTITAGDSVTFAGTVTDPEGDPVTVLWDFGDGQSSTSLSPGDHVYPTAGTFTVTFTATDSGGQADPSPASRTITVNPIATNLPPDGTITAPSGNVTITAGQSVAFSGIATDPEGGAVTVLWDFGDGQTSTALSPGDHAYPTAGTYTVTFTATDAAGLPDPTPDTRTVTVNPVVPTATLTMVQTQVFTPKCTNCHGGSSPEAGMNLEAGQAHANLVNVPATTQSGVRVAPGSPSSSVLYTFLVSGHRSSSVTAADRQLISDWITAGAQDD